MRAIVSTFFLLCSVPGWGSALTADERTRMLAADVVILGEVHDNPTHHVNQANWMQLLQPTAVIFEMLTPEQAGRMGRGQLSDSATLALELDWDNSGWPDFAMYYPVFAASGSARIFGAGVPRTGLGQAMESGIVKAFGADAEAYGLTIPLPADEQARREAFQHAAHCDALPEAMLPVMVDIQRLRDATLARSVSEAWQITGGPVAVVTGNGHARLDWGIAAYLSRVAPDLAVFSLGQSEDGAIAGSFDAVHDSPAVQRPDPCLAFAGAD